MSVLPRWNRTKCKPLAQDLEIGPRPAGWPGPNQSVRAYITPTRTNMRGPTTTDIERAHAPTVPERDHPAPTHRLTPM